jgi:hypothetical protein
MNANEFIRSLEDFLRRVGWPTGRSPWDFVEEWESLIDQVAAGYGWGMYEFTNELSVRDLLAKAFDDQQLRNFGQINSMRQRVEAADARLKESFLPEIEIGSADQPWWRRGVLARAGDEYADDVKRTYGIDIGGN